MKTGQFCWNELVTPDLAAAKKFYTDLLGWEYVDHEFGDMTYTIIKSQDNDVGGIWQIPSDKRDKIPPHWMAYILVENLDETLKKATQSGGTIKMPITHAAEMGRFFIMADPTGAYIAFWQPA